MKVEKHISDLLYLHDCVIVPNLGGFVANYANAKIHPTQHTFSPPSKKIVFNKNLNSNDGLLANCIVNFEKVEFPEAMASIEQFVSSTNIQLKEGKKVKIDTLGTLKLDVERNIQFTPADTNFQLDSFGLSDFQSPAIKRAPLGKRIEKEFMDRGPLPLEKRKRNIKHIVAVVILLPFIFGMIWIPLKTDLLNNINYSNLNPFASKAIKEIELAKEVPAPNTDVEKAKIAEEINTIQPEDIVNDTALNINLSLTKQAISNDQSEEGSVDAVVSVESNIAHVKADTTHVAPIQVIKKTNLKFHLVTGCFSIESNAHNFVSDLRNENLQASIIGQRNGLYVVSCGDFATRKEALENLSALKMSQPNAWLLKK